PGHARFPVRRLQSVGGGRRSERSGRGLLAQHQDVIRVPAHERRARDQVPRHDHPSARQLSHPHAQQLAPPPPPRPPKPPPHPPPPPPPPNPPSGPSPRPRPARPAATPGGGSGRSPSPGGSHTASSDS